MLYAIRHTLNGGYVSDWDDGRVLFEELTQSWRGEIHNAERLFRMFKKWGHRHLEIVSV